MFIKSIIGKSKKEKVKFEKQEKAMIKGITELSQTTVKEVIVPRIDVIFLSTESTFEEVVETVIKYGFSRFPVYEDTIDNVVGILYIKDLLKAITQKKEKFIIKDILRKAYFVPESKRLDSLLSEFKKRHVHIAIGVDEYGGISGIVCMEDIIEEIIGDIQDEFDNEVDDLIKISENEYLCDARTDISDFNSRFNFELPEDTFETLGGFVFNLFGKIPVMYEKVSYENCDFIIQKIENNKIKTLKMVIRK